MNFFILLFSKIPIKGERTASMSEYPRRKKYFHFIGGHFSYSSIAIHIASGNLLELKVTGDIRMLHVIRHKNDSYDEHIGQFTICHEELGDDVN